VPQEALKGRLYGTGSSSTVRYEGEAAVMERPTDRRKTPSFCITAPWFIVASEGALTDEPLGILEISYIEGHSCIGSQFSGSHLNISRFVDN